MSKSYGGTTSYSPKLRAQMKREAEKAEKRKKDNTEYMSVKDLFKKK